ncbi:MAG: CBS domain-containing protein [Lachnospiraceae bacterium]|nr:CBS domain-containing protein [Lachnospiraceae bacterium]
MYVKDHMTADPITISGDMTISKAVEIMRKNQFHRLPVTDAKGKLIGLITGGLVEEQSGQKNTSLSIFELNYLLSRRTVADIMIRDVTTTREDVFLEEAAQLMIDREIAVLPVVDDDGHVIGIITEKDIFQAFNDLLGHRHKGTRFIIQCEDHPGFLVGVTKCFADNDANLESLAIYRSATRGTELVLKATGEISVENMTKVLTDAGYQITGVAQTLEDGSVKHYAVT